MIYLLGGTTKKNCQRYIVDEDRWEPLYHLPQQFSTKAIPVGCQVKNHLYIFSLPIEGKELHLLQLEISTKTQSEQWLFSSLNLEPENFQLQEIIGLQSAIYDIKTREILIFGKGMLKKPGIISLIIKITVKLNKIESL